jgi:hypothetical protein
MVDERDAFGQRRSRARCSVCMSECALPLYDDKAHGRPPGRFRNRLGVPVIVLLCLDVGTHVLRRHQPDLVPLRRQLPPQMMSAAARFDRHHARGPWPSKTILDGYSRLDIDAKVNSPRIFSCRPPLLRQIDSGRRPCCRRPCRMPRRHRSPSDNLALCSPFRNAACTASGCIFRASSA